ncbi:hypothetical protein [Pseudomonas putida]|uniref:Uncharacterized protein n=1 Tax=Pseudomonas putida TaxID=303 RepID=A0A7V8EJA4_PSEPU|nr:hypothetical protein [Pseudomonas putida]KAF0255684.1 hypothetical protein GN299_06225 [Pseudomonas putida]
MNNRPEVIQPEVLELVALGNGFGSTKISGPDRASIRDKLKKAIVASKERYHRHGVSN